MLVTVIMTGQCLLVNRRNHFNESGIWLIKIVNPKWLQRYGCYEREQTYVVA